MSDTMKSKFMKDLEINMTIGRQELFAENTSLLREIFKDLYK